MDTSFGTKHRTITTLAWTAVALWAGVIFGFSSLPGSAIPGRYSVLGHFTEYFILGVLLVLALGRHSPGFIAAAVTVASAYGVTDEFHQLFIPGRCCDPADWAVDTVSAFLGALAVTWVLTRIVKRTRHHDDTEVAA